MSDDPAVRAVAGSVTFQTELQSLEDDTFGPEDTYGLNPGFRPFDEHVEAIARAAVAAARPIIEVEIAERVRAGYQKFLDTDDLDVLRDGLSELPWPPAAEAENPASVPWGRIEPVSEPTPPKMRAGCACGDNCTERGPHE